VHDLTTLEEFDDIDIALFSIGGSVGCKYGPTIVDNGAVVVDNSSTLLGQGAIVANLRRRASLPKRSTRPFGESDPSIPFLVCSSPFHANSFIH
jgi:hypothetical protein